MRSHLRIVPLNAHVGDRTRITTLEGLHATIAPHALHVSNDVDSLVFRARLNQRGLYEIFFCTT